MANGDTSSLHTEVKKSYFFLQKPLKTRVNSKYQSKGSSYILHLLAFVEIRLFNVFFWERKAGFGKLMKNVRDAGFSRKRERECGIRIPPPLPDPDLKVKFTCSRIYSEPERNTIYLLLIITFFRILYGCIISTFERTTMSMIFEIAL